MSSSAPGPPVSERGLLVNSFKLSAHRIMDALGRQLSIHNSRPTQPGVNANPIDKIVGRCGQGGQHHFFTISREAVTDAASRIRALSGSDSDNLDQLIAVSKRLRSQTTFDASTGCCNDAKPSLVALLPPEDIWDNDKELPLDVWRIIAFEYDAVSAAVASGLPISDLGKSNISYAALAFADLMNRLGQKEVEFNLSEYRLPKVHRGKLRKKTHRVPLRQLFFEAGTLLTPLSTNDFARWYMAARYVHWLSEASTELRVKKEFDTKEVDARYRGLFSEEMAIGIMAVVLREFFDVIRINNTAELGISNPGKPIADFVAEAVLSGDGSRIGIAAESKGSLGQEVNSQRRKHAKDQVRATKPKITGMVDLMGLAFSSSIHFDDSKSSTSCHVADPPIFENAIEFNVDPVTAWRTAYARQFRFLGFDYEAQRILNGATIRSLSVDVVIQNQFDETKVSVERNRRRKLLRDTYDAEYLSDLGDKVVAVDMGVVDQISRGITLETIPLIEKKLLQRRERERAVRKERQGPEWPASFIGSLGIGIVDVG